MAELPLDPPDDEEEEKPEPDWEEKAKERKEIDELIENDMLIDFRY